MNKIPNSILVGYVTEAFRYLPFTKEQIIAGDLPELEPFADTKSDEAPDEQHDQRPK